MMKKIQDVDCNMQQKEVANSNEIVWHSISEEAIRLSGFPYYKRDHKFQRIPISYESILNGVNPELVELAKNTAGGQIAFATDSDKIYIKAKVTQEFNMVNMTPVSQCGFDCYIGKTTKNLRFFGITRFDITKKSYECELASLPKGYGLSQVQINFPLYCGVEEVQIGILKGAKLQSPEAYEKEGQIVFYGTSIIQGACASRPGMAYTHRICRSLNVEQYNFGFSGNAFGDIEIAEILAKLNNPLLYVIDYEANGGLNGSLEKTLKEFILKIRAVHREIPILVVSRIPYFMDELDESLGARRKQLREFQENTVNCLRQEGDLNIWFYDGSNLLKKNCSDETIDTIHPTDYGFAMMAERLEPVISRLIMKSQE